LSARAVVFERDGRRLVLVSSDIIGYYGESCREFREAICGKYGLSPGELFLSAIHTHAAPRITLDEENGHPNNVQYTRQLGGKLLDLVGEALQRTRPVVLSYGSGSSMVGVNRREIFYDEKGNARTWIGRNPDGVMDREVQVLKVTDTADRPLAVLFDYAVHSTSLGWENYQISGDVHGLAEQFIENYLGGDVIAPAFAGASGDIDPWYRVLPGFRTKNGWIPESVLLGTLLGEEVVHVLDEAEGIGEDPIETAFATLELPAKPAAEGDSTAQRSRIDLNVTLARMGDLLFVGLGCEALCEIGLSIKAALPNLDVFVITHCNGTSGYLPPGHRYVEGGYEIQSTPFAATAADIVIKEVVRMAHAL